MSEDKDQDLLDKIGKYKSLSEDMISIYHDQWTSNIRLLKGVFPDDENVRSKVRKRSKIFFRKIWASRWRLLASFYNAFLRDPDNFKIVGRDTGQDPKKAAILQKMVEYRRDLLNSKHSLFMKHLSAFMNILDMGWCAGKMRWVFDEEAGKDEPQYTVYPNEQVWPDLMASTPEEMRFCIFESYMSKDELEEEGYDNIDKAQPESVPSNQVRHARYMGQNDPLQNPRDTEYPKAGKYFGDDRKDTGAAAHYRVWECFHKVAGKWKIVVTNATYCVLKQEKDSPYGDCIPGVFGTCLAEANKLIGEGLPEPLEGPQVSYNTNLNQRKDNVALSLNGMSYVSRYGNVDLESLTNSRPGGIVLMDDIANVVDRKIPDVTQAAYMEAAEDERMMDEMSGVTAQKRGMGGEEKATVAQINYSESNAKIDLFIAIVAETYFRRFYYLLAKMIQSFETDDTVFRVANEALGQNTLIWNVDFDADCIVEAGMGTTGRDLELKQTFLAMDRAVMSNQSAIALLQTGLVPKGTPVKIIDTTQFLVDALPKLGKRDFSRYFIQFQTAGEGGAGGQNPSMAGRTQPQIGDGISDGREGVNGV